jgi:hypothetical protein
MDSKGQLYRSPLLEEGSFLQEVRSLPPSLTPTLPRSHACFDPTVPGVEVNFLHAWPEKKA